MCNPVSNYDAFCDNYLIKLKYDTKDFIKIKALKENFNVFEGRYADVFLLHMSLNSKPIVGADIRSLR